MTTAPRVRGIIDTIVTGLMAANKVLTGGRQTACRGAPTDNSGQ